MESQLKLNLDIVREIEEITYCIYIYLKIFMYIHTYIHTYVMDLGYSHTYRFDVTQAHIMIMVQYSNNDNHEVVVLIVVCDALFQVVD